MDIAYVAIASHWCGSAPPTTTSLVLLPARGPVLPCTLPPLQRCHSPRPVAPCQDESPIGVLLPWNPVACDAYYASSSGTACHYAMHTLLPHAPWHAVPPHPTIPMGPICAGPSLPGRGMQLSPHCRCHRHRSSLHLVTLRFQLLWLGLRSRSWLPLWRSDQGWGGGITSYDFALHFLYYG